MATMKISIVLLFFACHQTQSDFSNQAFVEFVSSGSPTEIETTDKYNSTEKDELAGNQPSGKNESTGNQSTLKIELARNERGIDTEANKGRSENSEKNSAESDHNVNEESNTETTVLKNIGGVQESSTIKISSNLRNSVTQDTNKTKHSTHRPTFKPTIIDEIKSNGSNFANTIQTMISEEVQKHLKLMLNEPTSSKSPHIDKPTNNGKNNNNSITHSRMSNFSRHTQGRNTQGDDDTPCDGMDKDDNEKLNSSDLNKNQGTMRPQGEIEEAASNILPNVRNITETTASSIEMNTQNTTTNPAKNGGYSTIWPLNKNTNGTSTLKPASKKQRNEKWKKLLKFLGSAIGVFTLVGGAFYIVHSVTFTF